MISKALFSPVRNCCLLLILLVGMLLIAGEAAYGQSVEPQADSGFPTAPLHPAKIVIQLAVVGGLMAFWTLRPDPLRRVLQIGITAEVCYAMLQDQISVRMCPEYFTVAHPRIEAITNLTLMGLAWGFLGAWWGGALIGAITGFCARLGSWPKLNPQDLLRPFALLLLFQAGATAAGGWIATYEVTEPGFTIIAPLASLIPEERHNACYIVSRMHQGTYLSAIVGGLLICGYVVRRRWRLAKTDRTDSLVAIYPVVSVR